MPMYNLIEYSSSYSESTGSLWFYSKDEATTFNANIADKNNFTSFKYKTKLLKNRIVDGNRCTIKISKYLLAIAQNVID